MGTRESSTAILLSRIGLTRIDRNWTPYLEPTRDPKRCSVSLDFLSERTEPTESYQYDEDGDASSGARRRRHGY
jgi:hypothetical protein